MTKSLQFFLLLFTVLSVQLHAQQRTIQGQVLDQEGLSIPGVSVYVQGSSTGTVTDFNGDFSLNVTGDDLVLVFSYVGFQTREIPLEGRSYLEVVLEDDVQSLQEVVVVGYGTQIRENLTGAVSQVSAEDIALRPSANISSSLQGLMPGLNIQVNNGDPTATPDINVRGFNSINGGGPLVLIDGIEGDITRVNPQDIENVTVLKDAASAAIYGARGAFGVILITTKTGKAGDITVDYSNNLSWTTPTTRTDFVSDGYTYGKTIDAAIGGYNGSSYTGFDAMDWEAMRMVSNGEIEPFHELQPNGTYKFFYNTDWHDYLFKKWQPSQMHNISISGGTDKLRGYLSGRVYDRETINNIQDAEMKRYNLKSNLVFNPTDWLELSNTTTFVHEQDQDFGGYRNGYGGIWSTTTWYDLFAFYPHHVDGMPVDIGRGGAGGQG